MDILLVMHNVSAQYSPEFLSSHLERILTYNEKPLLLMKQLKEANESPVFMLKHIRQMKSPAVNAPSPPNSHPPRKSSDLLNKELPLPPEMMAAATGPTAAALMAGNAQATGLNGQGHSGSALARSGTSASMRSSSKPSGGGKDPE
jgi:hypothetical protein